MPETTALDDLDATPHAALFDGPRLRMVRLQLDADQHVPPHTHPGTTVVLHVLSGELELAIDEETYELQAGQLVRFDGDREVAPSAVEPSAAVVVFVPAADESSGRLAHR